MIELCETPQPVAGSPGAVRAPKVFDAEEGSTPIELLTQLARHKWLIAKITSASILIGAILCMVLPLRFTAVAKLMPPQQTGSAASFFMNQLAGSGASSLTALAGGGLSLKNPNDLYIGLLESRLVADAIVRRFDLTKAYRTKTMAAARERLAGNAKITSEKSGLISITVTDGDMRRAADIANAYTDELRALTKNLAVTEAARRRLFYEDQLRQTKDALDAAEVHFQDVQQKSGLVSLNAQSVAMIESLGSLHAQVAAKQVEVEAMRSYSTDNNPEVQLAKSELRSLETEAARAEQHGRSSAPSGLGLADVPEAGMEYLRAQHEVQYQLTLFDLLLKQYDAARLDEGKEAAIIQVVEPAVPPEKKSAPQRGVIMLLATLIGLFVSYLVVRLLHWLETEEANPVHGEALRNLKNALTGQSKGTR